MKVAVVVSDLILYSRIESAAHRSGAELVRSDHPAGLPEGVDLVLVDWSARGGDWGAALRSAREAGARVVLFGPHTDLEAHAAARGEHLGPMQARSKVLSALPKLMSSGIGRT